ncbi:hypothetical protein F4777DRAFT_531738 [Nemania sp. FL0916]|nr:hypothetical protein F4777DRAFT_531738 [Nemania sp. FL0916]
MRVAIAGYGDLARYVVEEFVKAGHVVVILTQNHKPHLDGQGVTQAVTDYTLSSLRAPLADCHVLISTIWDASSAYTDVHGTLIQACQESPNCKRFIPAEFSGDIETYPDQPGFYYATHEPIRNALRSQKDLEWTLVCLGWLTDYFIPVKNRHIKDIGECHPMNWEGDKIVIAGTGNEPVDFTWARDVARALASLVKAPAGSWEPYTFMSGERSCWNEATKLSKQKYRPHVPIEHVSLHTVAETIKTAKDESTLMLADYHLLSISQACASPPNRVQAHKEKFFSDVNFRTLQDGLTQFDQYPDSVL